METEIKIDSIVDETTQIGLYLPLSRVNPGIGPIQKVTIVVQESYGGPQYSTIVSIGRKSAASIIASGVRFDDCMFLQ